MPRVPWYSGSAPSCPAPPGVAYGTLTRSGAASQRLPLPARAPQPAAAACAAAAPPYNPDQQPPHSRGTAELRPVWALPGSLATTTGISRAGVAASPHLLISLPRGTEMFQFPRCPWSCLCIQHAMRPLARSRVAPFGFAWLIARLQLPRHVSPLSAPFLGT